MARPKYRLVAKHRETGEYRDFGAVWENTPKNGTGTFLSISFSEAAEGKYPKLGGVLVDAAGDKVTDNYFLNLVPSERPKRKSEPEDVDDGFDD